MRVVAMKNALKWCCLPLKCAFLPIIKIMAQLLSL